MLHALADMPQRSLFKLVCTGPERRVVGIPLMGEAADEILQGFAVALKRGITLDDLPDTVAIHPTSGEDGVVMPLVLRTRTGEGAWAGGGWGTGRSGTRAKGQGGVS